MYVSAGASSRRRPARIVPGELREPIQKLRAGQEGVGAPATNARKQAAICRQCARVAVGPWRAGS